MGRILKERQLCLKLMECIFYELMGRILKERQLPVCLKLMEFILQCLKLIKCILRVSCVQYIYISHSWGGGLCFNDDNGMLLGLPLETETNNTQIFCSTSNIASRLRVCVCGSQPISPNLLEKK